MSTKKLPECTEHHKLVYKYLRVDFTLSLHEGFTLEADSIVARVWVGVSCLVGEQIDSSHSQEPPSTLGPGDIDRVAYTPVRQPASVTHIHASLPGQVKLSGGGEPGAEFGTLISRFIEGKLLYRNGVEDSAWEERGGETSTLMGQSKVVCSVQRFHVGRVASAATLVRRVYLSSSQQNSTRRRSRSHLSHHRFSRRGSSPCLQSNAPVALGWGTLIIKRNISQEMDLAEKSVKT